MKFKLSYFVAMSMLFAFAGSEANAQSISDAEIVSYAKQRSGSGADAKTIGAELLAKGATREQLQRVYTEYQNGSAGTGAGASTSASTPEEKRGRINNGEDTPAPVAAPGGRTVFGRDIFRTKNLSFEPNMNVPVPTSYVLGPGDEVIIDVYGASQTSNTYVIAPEGTINIAGVGPVTLSGLSLDGAQKRINSVLGKHYQSSTIKVNVGQTRTITINIMGEVGTPGTYTLSAFATVFHALYMAGGISNIGTLRNIQVNRNGKTISKVDVYEYILNGKLAGNVNLRDGDVIIVNPYSKLVQITGNVRRPMWYELKENETLSTLIGFAGDFTGAAYTKNVSVERSSGERLTVHTVDEFQFKSFILKDEDHVEVGGNERRYIDMAVISGAVKRPGNYQLSKVNSVRGLIEAAGGLQEDAQTTRAVITRLNENRTSRTISFDVAAILSGSAPDIMLQNEDHITIASMSRIFGEKQYTIEGEVYNPGTYPFADNTTIEDLITKAGGLRESASFLNVEVSRRIFDPMADHESEIRNEAFNFTLSDGLVIGQGTEFILEPYDRVYIRRSPVYNDQRTVNVSGEIMFAGNYVLREQVVHLSEVIERAGGLKTKASARDARLIRQMDDAERMRAQQAARIAAIDSDTTKTVHLDMSTSYVVAIDLAKALNNPGSEFDVVLRDGDQIVIPQLSSTVKINGEVMLPNTVTYKPGAGWRYYINQAGGFTTESVRRKAYVVYANGHASKLRKAKIEPGAEIVVPTKVQKPHNNNTTAMWVSLTASIASTAAVVATAIAALTR